MAVCQKLNHYRCWLYESIYNFFFLFKSIFKIVNLDCSNHYVTFLEGADEELAKTKLCT